MFCIRGLTRASQQVLLSAWAASISGRKRSAKFCSWRRAPFSLERRRRSSDPKAYVTQQAASTQGNISEEPWTSRMLHSALREISYLFFPSTAHLRML